MKTLTVIPLLSLAVTAGALAQADQVSRSWNQPIDPFRIAGSLYYVGASDVTSFLITTPEGHILIDGGFEETAPMIIANVRRLGFRIEDVRVLLASHAHYDHAGGLAALKRASRATFYSSTGDAPLFERGGRRDPQFRDRFPFPPIKPDRLIEDGETITLGGTTLVARLTPGHTPGCTTWTTTAGDGVESFDVVFLCSPTVPADYRLTTNRRYPGADADYRRQFETLRALHPDIFLGSHGSFFGLEEKRKTGSFVDPEGYRTFVEAKARAFEEHAAGETMVLHDITVIDGTGAAAQAHRDVVLSHGRITAIESADTFTHPPIRMARVSSPAPASS